MQESGSFAVLRITIERGGFHGRGWSHALSKSIFETAWQLLTSDLFQVVEVAAGYEEQAEEGQVVANVHQHAGRH
jgi:hypothetical protein